MDFNRPTRAEMRINMNETNESKHTPYRMEGNRIIGDKGVVCYLYDTRPADRIIALLNMADRLGLTTEQIEGGVVDRLRASNAELMAALQSQVNRFDAMDNATPWQESEPDWWLAWNDAAIEARQIIAKAKEVQQ
jgi:hypothetical protein